MFSSRSQTLLVTYKCLTNVTKTVISKFKTKLLLRLLCHQSTKLICREFPNTATEYQLQLPLSMLPVDSTDYDLWTAFCLFVIMS